jgi:AcrR family transcriptional regulator
MAESKLSEKKARTRQKLLEATLAVMADSGLHGLSLDAVAKRVGVTKGAIYDNFESKDAMIVAAFAMLPEEATAAFVWPTDRSGTIKARMRRLGEAVADAQGGAGRSPIGQVEFLLYALTHQDMRQRLAGISSMGPTRTKERLLDLFAPEELPMSPDAFALLLHSLVPGLSQFRAVAPRPPSRELIVEMFEGFAAAK